MNLEEAERVLREAHILRAVTHHGRIALHLSQLYPSHETRPSFFNEYFLHAPLSDIAYDTRHVKTPHTLFVIKGNFKAEYFSSLSTDSRPSNGQSPASALPLLGAYVARRDFSDATNAIGFIVTDEHAALSVLSAEFFGHPERALTLLSLTGTKGKTTTAYLAQALINATDARCGLISTQGICVDGTHYLPAHLTTPESREIFSYLAQARNNGLTHMIIEASSQGYKRGRLSHIYFDAAAFLNISPDHISDIEHPTFEDYLWCKRQITRHCTTFVVNIHADYSDIFIHDAAHAGARIVRFACVDPSSRDVSSHKKTLTDVDGEVDIFGSINPDRSCDISGTLIHSSSDHTSFAHTHGSLTFENNAASSDHSFAMHIPTLALPGAVNIENALCAIALARAVDIPLSQSAIDALSQVHVPGRMEYIHLAPRLEAFVDYAHNYLSTRALLDEVTRKWPHARIVLLTGATGGKAIDRRSEIIDASFALTHHYVLTSDDPGDEDPHDIAEYMREKINNLTLSSSHHPSVHIEVDREKAVAYAYDLASRLHEQTHETVVLCLIGKGQEKTQKGPEGKTYPYAGDRPLLMKYAHIFDEKA